MLRQSQNPPSAVLKKASGFAGAFFVHSEKKTGLEVEFFMMLMECLQSLRRT
jgi:hypothetical protein